MNCPPKDGKLRALATPPLTLQDTCQTSKGSVVPVGVGLGVGVNVGVGEATWHKGASACGLLGFRAAEPGAGQLSKPGKTEYKFPTGITLRVPVPCCHSSLMRALPVSSKCSRRIQWNPAVRPVVGIS
jgi:hypothetical protein